MKTMLNIILVAILAFTVVPAYADRPTGDPLGVKILEAYLGNFTAKYDGLTIKLSDNEVKQFKAGKYHAKYVHSGAWYQIYKVAVHGIIHFQSNGGSRESSCSLMELNGNQLKIEGQNTIEDQDSINPCN